MYEKTGTATFKMPTYVLDTSVVVQWFHYPREQHVAEAQKLWKDLESGRINIILPNILLLELLNVSIKVKKSTAEKTCLLLVALLQAPVTIVDINLPVLKLAAGLMEEYNLTSYDAYFLALAQIEDCKLISGDQKAHGQIKDGTVIMLEDYK